MTFRKWLNGCMYDDTAVGDLARDMYIDRDAPKSNSYKTLYKYLESVQASSGALEALEYAYSAYDNGRKKYGYIRKQ